MSGTVRINETLRDKKKNQHVGLCIQQACESAQCDQCIHCPYKKATVLRLSDAHIAKTYYSLGTRS